MFSIGDKIVYPMYGAGKIIDIEEKDILGETKEYFILVMPVGDMKISIPVNKINTIGIRSIISRDMVEEIYDILRSNTGEMSSNWNQRNKDNLEKLRTGDILQVAEVYRDLYTLDHEKGLSMVEKKVLNTSKKMLLSELSIVEEKEVEEIKFKIEKLLIVKEGEDLFER